MTQPRETDRFLAPPSEPERRQRVRSFVRRAGRLTSAQRRALELHWSRYGLEGSGLLDLDAIFERRAPRWLELGFGMGDALIELARRHPQRDFLGIDVYDPGIGRLLARCAQLGLDNVRVLRGDAVELIETCFAPRAFDGVLIYFPDPWPKKRHHKRRLIQPEFVHLLCSRVRAGGRIELATDWEDYATHMLAVLDAEPCLRNLAGSGQFAPRPGERPLTKFERRGEGLGHPIRDLLCVVEDE